MGYVPEEPVTCPCRNAGESESQGTASPGGLKVYSKTSNKRPPLINDHLCMPMYLADLKIHTIPSNE